MILWLGAAWGADITVWHAYRDAEEDALEAAGDAYQAISGDKISFVQIPFDGYTTKLETTIPRGNGPDLFVASHDNLGKWSAMGVVDPPSTPVEGHLPVTIEALTVKGRVQGWPLAYKSLLLLYDKALVKEPARTTDALLAQAKQLPDGVYGLVFEAGSPYSHGPILHAFGARALEPDGTAKLDTPEQAAAYAFSKRLAIDEGIVPAQPTYVVMETLFDEGRAAYVISGSWFVPGRARDIGATTLPVVSETGEPMAPYLGVDAIYRTPDAEPAAAGFAEFLSRGEGARIRSEQGGQAVSDASVTSDDPIVQALAAQARNAVPMPNDPNTSSAFEAIARSLLSVQRGARTPEEAAADAQEFFDVFSRPLPPAADPRPWLAFLAILVLGGLGLVAQRARDPELRARVSRHASDYLWIAPAGLSMSVLVILPFVTGAAVSLFAHRAGEWRFVGLAHFLDILLARDFPITSPLSFVFTLGVTVLWTTVNIVLHVSIGMALAMLLREPWVRLRAVWRALLIIPWAVPNYITALIWKGMFHAQFGAVNAILGFVLMRDGPLELDWFGSFSTAFCANLVTNTWLGFPFMMVVTLGALQSIPRDLEEAAEVDGAGRWFAFRHVVYPMLKPALLPAVVLGSVWTFNMFNVIFLVSGGEPNSSTEILISDAYRWAFKRGNHYGYAAAYAVLIFGVLLVYSRSANRLVGKKVI
ncbi:MAG: extracellular solute-binding protein [Alphaproteobacteria bacterium]|nr:extracellular solute-binding protein [Alphaproteobacteria bacterium]